MPRTQVSIRGHYSSQELPKGTSLVLRGGTVLLLCSRTATSVAAGDTALAAHLAEQQLGKIKTLFSSASCLLWATLCACASRNLGSASRLAAGDTAIRRESAKLTKNRLPQPRSSPKCQRGHTKSEELTLQPTGCTAGGVELGIARLVPALSSPVPWIPAGDPPGTSLGPTITQTSQKYLGKRLRVSRSICWGGAVPAGVKYQSRAEKVPLFFSRPQDQKGKG